jgi:tetratricopeptide (TPR) repeat protein
MRTARRPTGDGSIFVNRTDQRGRLRAALEDQVTSVIMVSGPPGIGKTALVREVLAELNWSDPNEEDFVRWHDATQHGEIAVPTLVADIEPPASGRVVGPTARARLEIALDGLDKLGGMPPVIVIDAAETLLDGGRLLRDSELDLALEASHARLRPVVKVVFVTQDVPKATTGVAWTRTACRIGLEGLEPPSLREHLAELDPAGEHGLADLPDNDLRIINGLLAGNPRLVELLHAVLSSDPPGLRAHEVGQWLSSVPASEVHQRLVRRFVDHLPDDQRVTAEGLAALGVPVPPDVLIGVLEPYVPATRAEHVLRALAAARLILQRRDGHVSLRSTEINAVLGTPRHDLVLRAAQVLSSMQKDDYDVHGMVDLDMHFARIDLWLRAGRHEQAHGLIEKTDELLRRLGGGAELRTQREAVRGRLGDDREGEMINLAALGAIYSDDGDLHSALAAYEAALAIAKRQQFREALSQIYLGMGAMFLAHDRLAEAEQSYRWALGLADEDDADGGDAEVVGDRAAALVGLADCRQRQGNYRNALVGALTAFDTLCEAEPDLAMKAALRLTRWYAELDQVTDALTMLARCDELTSVHTSPSARAELFTATADMYLYQDRYREARMAAERAVDFARAHRLPNDLRRSLSTLALAHVHLDDFPAARRAIEESARYRVAAHETVELALRAIITHCCDLPGTARDLFQQLRDETSDRISTDTFDLSAWDFAGVAHCYSVLLGQAELAAALTAFRHARPDSADQTPGLDDRVRFMVKTLANGDPRLDDVLEALARFRPGRSR